MGIVLKHEHPLPVMGKQAVAISGTGIGTASMPALSVENEHAAGLCLGLHEIFDAAASRGAAAPALMGSGYNTRTTICF